MVVFYRLTDRLDVPTAQCHFVEPLDDNDRNLMVTINREIEGFVPAEDREYNSASESWEVTRNHWEFVSDAIRKKGLLLYEREEPIEGFRSNTREIGTLTLFATAPLFLFMLMNIVAHVFHTKSFVVPIRPMLCIAFLLLTFVSFRFGHNFQGIASIGLVIAFNPFEAFYISNWYIWQLFNWLSLVFLFVASIRSLSDASKERELDLWWVNVRK